MVKRSKPPIRVTASSLSGFQEALERRGVTPGTAKCYADDIRLAHEGGQDLIDRLLDANLAPKTRHRILSAGRQWADHTKNDELAVELKRFRLPAARRQAAKVPMERSDLHVLVDAIGTADHLSPYVRAVIGVMACRGLRSGDVLRIKRIEITRALESGVLSFEAKGRKRLEFKVTKNYRAHLVTLAGAPGRWSTVDEIISPNADADTRRKAAARAVGRALVHMGAKAGIWGLYPHRLRRTYAVEYLRSLKGDPEAIIKLQQHMQWASAATAMEYIDHARGDELDEVAERIFER